MINIFGIVLISVITIFAFKTAKEYERKPILWAIITFAAGFGIQILLPAFILVFIAIIATVSGSSTQKIQDKIPFVTISVICIILSIVAGFLILRFLAKIPEETSLNAPPAPPSDFNQNS